MASNFPLIVFLLLVSLSLTSGSSLFTRDAVSKQEDESNVMAMHTSDQGSSTILVEDLVKAPSLHATVAGSKVVVNNEADSKRSSKRSKKGSTTAYKKSKKVVGSLDITELVEVIIAAVVFIIVIIIIIYFLRRKTKKGSSIEQGFYR